MTDECKNCLRRGDYDACISTECSQHESWIALQRIRLIKKYEECLVTIAAQSSGIPTSTKKSDCMAALAQVALQGESK